jgi:hypothetical protein
MIVTENKWLHRSVGVATGRTSGGSIPGREKEYSLLHNVQTGSSAHQTAYPMGTGALSLRAK